MFAQKQGNNDGNHKTAINYYNKAISMDRDNLLGYVSRGILYARLNKGTDAISDFEKALRINKSSYVYCSYGFAKRLMDDLHGALDNFDQSIQIDPLNLQAYEYRAELRMVMGDLNGALDDYNKHIELAPDNKWAWSSRAMLRMNLGDIQGATHDFNKALDIDKNFSMARFGRAELFRSMGKYELSIADQIKYYDLEGIPDLKFDDPKQKEIANSVHKHLREFVLPEIKKGDEKLIDFWICAFHWGKLQTRSMSKGTQALGLHGKYGIGYLCLSDKYLRIVSIGSLSIKYANFGSGIIKRVFSTLFLHTHDLRSAEKSDKQWIIPFKDIQSVNREDGGFNLVALSEIWEVVNHNGNDEYLLSALEIARSGNLRRVIDMERLHLRSNTSDSKEDILKTIESLASLKDKGILSNDEFEQKKNELLARL